MNFFLKIYSFPLGPQPRIQKNFERKVIQHHFCKVENLTLCKRVVPQTVP